MNKNKRGFFFYVGKNRNKESRKKYKKYKAIKNPLDQ